MIAWSDALWTPVPKFTPAAAHLADGHYSPRTIGSPQFIVEQRLSAVSRAPDRRPAGPLEAEVERLRGALEAIIDHLCVVPDHPHGGIHPPYLEWKPVAHIAREALRKAKS